MLDIVTEIIVFTFFSLIVPMLINKSTEKGRLDWIEPHLRIIWTVLFIFFTMYLLQKPVISGVIMEFRKWFNNPMLGYLVWALIGATVFCGYWWFSGRAFVPRNNEKKLDMSQRQPTAEEIATEVLKKMPVNPVETKKESQVKKTQDEIKSAPLTQIFVQLPPTGNIKQRSIALSKEIMNDLYIHGWRQQPNAPQSDSFIQRMPIAPDEFIKWAEKRSRFFWFRFITRVIDIRNELSQLHLSDERLDDTLKSIGVKMAANNQFIKGEYLGFQNENRIIPLQIEEIAQRLKILSDQIK